MLMSKRKWKWKLSNCIELNAIEKIISTVSRCLSTKAIHALFGCIVATHVFAADIQNVGQVEQIIPAAPGKTQTITLDKYELSDKARRALSSHLQGQRSVAQQAHRALSNSAPESLPSAVQLGMNDIPVLKQGRHGTCTTFAVTAAIDATLNQGQYTSQLCLLRLGQYLQRTNWVSSGWNGLTAAILLLDRIKQNGIISIENQERHGCGGVFAYPEKSGVPEGEMSLKEYRLYHEALPADQVSWSFLWSKYGFLFEGNAVNKTKIALSKGNRVLANLILPRIYLGVAGATGTHHARDDTWVLTREIENNIRRDVEGHTMVVTGYDDAAYAIDRNGDIHQGLFTLRNSWGPHAGDHGDFYVSYDYYSGLTSEAIQIGQAPIH
jgi:hypothetical protein